MPPALFVTIISTIILVLILKGNFQKNPDSIEKNPPIQETLTEETQTETDSNTGTDSPETQTNSKSTDDGQKDKRDEKKLEKTSFIFNAEREYSLDKIFPVEIMVVSDKDSTNLFVAEIEFSKNIFEVLKIETQDSFATVWADKYIDNEKGKINLVGGVPNPGLKTQKETFFARIILKPKKNGEGTISFTKNSMIFRNLDNQNILEESKKIHIKIGKKHEEKNNSAD